MGTRAVLAACAHSMTAVICGTPTPAMTLVVQIEPGPIPTFTASAPALMRSRVASAVAMLPATISTRLRSRRPFLTRGIGAVGSFLFLVVRDHEVVAVALVREQRH